MVAWLRGRRFRRADAFAEGASPCRADRRHGANRRLNARRRPLSRLSWALIRSNKKTAAQPLLTRAVLLNPSDAETRRELAGVLAAANRTDEALRFYKGLSLDPATRSQLAWLHCQKKDFAGAADECRTAVAETGRSKTDPATGGHSQLEGRPSRRDRAFRETAKRTVRRRDRSGSHRGNNSLERRCGRRRSTSHRIARSELQSPDALEVVRRRRRRCENDESLGAQDCRTSRRPAVGPRFRRSCVPQSPRLDAPSQQENSVRWTVARPRGCAADQGTETRCGSRGRFLRGRSWTSRTPAAAIFAAGRGRFTATGDDPRVAFRLARRRT